MVGWFFTTGSPRYKPSKSPVTRLPQPSIAGWQVLCPNEKSAYQLLDTHMLALLTQKPRLKSPKGEILKNDAPVAEKSLLSWKLQRVSSRCNAA